MRSPTSRNRFIVTSILVLVAFALTVPFVPAQSRPGESPASRPVNFTPRDRIKAKVEDLSRQIADQLKARRQLERADSTLSIYEEAAAGGKAIETFDPTLKQSQYNINLMEIERDVSLQTTGSENIRYKALVKRIELMKQSNARQLESAKSKIAESVDQAKAEAVAAKTRLEIANALVEASKRELVELAAAGR